MSHMWFRVNLLSVVAWMPRNSLLETGVVWSFSDCNGIQTHNQLVHKETLKHLAKLVLSVNHSN